MSNDIVAIHWDGSNYDTFRWNVKSMLECQVNPDGRRRHGTHHSGLVRYPWVSGSSNIQFELGEGKCADNTRRGSGDHSYFPH